MDLFGRKSAKRVKVLLTILRVAEDVVADKDKQVEKLGAALISQRVAIDRFMAGLSNLHEKGIESEDYTSDASPMPSSSALIGSDAKLRFSSEPLYLSEQEEDIRYALEHEFIDAKTAEDMLAQLNFDNAEITLDYEQI